MPQSVLKAAFSLPRPILGKKSLGEAVLSDGDKMIVTVTRVKDGDISTMSDTDIEKIKLDLEGRSSELDFAAMYNTLEAESSIKRP